MTGQAKLSSVPEVRRAVETSGQTALVDVLEEMGDAEPASADHRHAERHRLLELDVKLTRRPRP
jgi:hypothetical protein